VSDCPCEGEMNADALHMQMKPMALKIVAKAIVAFLQFIYQEGKGDVVVWVYDGKYDMMI